MSILNAWIERGHALIGVDTEVFAPEGESLGHFSKMVPLVHMNAVFAFRGQYAVFATLHTSAVWRPIGFDDLAAEMPALLRDAVKLAGDVVRQMGAGAVAMAPLNHLDLALVGYSPNARNVIGYAYSWDEELAEFRGNRIPDGEGLFAPATPEWLKQHMPAAPITGEKLAELAQRQMELVREKHPVPATGGQFVVAYIDRRGMAIRSVGNLKA